jgi:hypothetical protein
MNKKSQVWFAWYPVYLESGRWAWLEKVRRFWNDRYHLQVIHPDDRGEWVGGWRYRTLNSKKP